MNNHSKSFLGGVLLSVGLASTAFAEDNCTPRHENVQTIEKGYITPAVTIVVPASFLDDSGKLSGIDADILAEIARMECLEIKPLMVDPAAAIQAEGTGADIRNDGTIMGMAGIFVAGDSKIVNTGKLVGGIDAVITSNTADDTALIVNHGLLKAVDVSIDGSLGVETVRNDGRIVGDIFLREGNDKVDTRGGTIAGKIEGGLGNDTLITGNAKYVLTENANEGFDTVKSTVSYKLTDNVETLVLLGKKNINATGNDGAENYLYGNAGNNVLRGHDGYNELFGRGGKDTLIGGADYDLFGLGKGYGRDTVRNFQDGLDQIDIYKLGVDTYAALKPHIRQHGDDTWIAFGKDVLILEGIDRSALDASDFLFNY